MRAAAPILLVLFPVALWAQGFGVVKITAKLERKRRPEVYPMKTAIQISVESQSSMGSVLRQQFETMARHRVPIE